MLTEESKYHQRNSWSDGTDGNMKRPFLEMFYLFLLIALFVANAWGFPFRADHPLSSLAVSVLVVLVVGIGHYHVLRRRAE